MGMKQILVMMAVVVLVGQSVVADEKLIVDPIVKDSVRYRLKKPEGELTNADLEKVTRLNLGKTNITDEGLKEVAKLQKLTFLSLTNTKITDAGLKEVGKLQQLEYLAVGKTQITDEGLKELAKLNKIKGFWLSATLSLIHISEPTRPY